MADSLAILSDAKALALKYGPGPSKSAAQGADFQAVMLRAGLSEGQACVLTAWLGGVAPASSWKPAWLEGETAESACARSVSDPPKVDDALAALMARAPIFGALVVTKAESKSLKDWQDLAANAYQATKLATKDAYDGAKEAAKFLKGEGVDLALGVFDFVADVGKGAQDAAADLIGNAADNAWEVFGKVVPWWAVVLAIVLSLAALGGWLWWQHKSGGAALKALGLGGGA